MLPILKHWYTILDCYYVLLLLCGLNSGVVLYSEVILLMESSTTVYLIWYRSRI